MEGSAFASSYKKKSTTIDKRTLRAHRRSIEWKKLREDSYCKTRDLESCSSAESDVNLSMVEEGDESYKSSPVRTGKTSPVTSRSSTKRRPLQHHNVQVDEKSKKPDRREMLLKWKAEKELKKKITSKEKKPMFKVAHVVQADIQQISKLPKPTKSVCGQASSQQRATKNTKPKEVVKKAADTEKEAKVTRSRSTAQPPPAAAAPSTRRASAAAKTSRPSTSNHSQPKPTTRQSAASKAKPETRATTTTKASSSSSSSSSAAAAAAATTAKTGRLRSSVPSGAPQPPASRSESSRATRRSTRIKTLDRSKDMSGSQKTTTLEKGDKFRWVSAERNTDVEMPSFAPANFTFDFAAGNGKQFVFTPLSPNTAASFFGGGGGGGKMNKNPGGRASSTPKGHRTCEVALTNPVLTESESSQSNTDSDSGKDDKSVRSRRGRRSRANYKQENRNDQITDIKVEEVKVISSPVIRGRKKSIDQSLVNGPSTARLTETASGLQADENIAMETEESVPEPVVDQHNDSAVLMEQDDRIAEEEPITTRDHDLSPVLEVMEEVKDTVEEDKENRASTSVDAVFATPQDIRTPRRQRRVRSMSRLGGSAKRTPRMHNSSLVLRRMSPEDAIEVLKNSPMVEMKRRTPKSNLSTSFIADDIEHLDEEIEDIPPQPDFTDPAPQTSAPITEEVKGHQEKVKVEQQDKVRSQQEESQAQLEAVISQQDEVIGQQDVAKGQQDEVKGQQDGAEVNNTPEPDSVASGEDGEHDVKYFRNLLRSETDRLSTLGEKWMAVNDSTQLSEDIHGQIRTTVGQANLLMAQRFKQFSGLVDNCEFKRGEKETSCTDLQGFWDMVYFQVEDVNTKFDELEKLKAGNWVTQTTAAAITKKVRKVSTSKPAASKKPVKSKFAEFKAKMKAEKASSQDAMTMKEDVPEMKTFDAGLFVVTSPVKTPSPHCDSNTVVTSVKKVQNASCASPWFKCVLNKSLRRSLNLTASPAVNDSVTVTSKSLNDKSKLNDTPRRAKNDTPRRSTRRSIRLSGQVPAAAAAAAGDDSFSKYLTASEPSDTISPASKFADLSLDSPRTTRSRKSRAPSLLFTPERKSPVKRRRTMKGDLISFSPM